MTLNPDGTCTVCGRVVGPISQGLGLETPMTVDHGEKRRVLEMVHEAYIISVKNAEHIEHVPGFDDILRDYLDGIERLNRRFDDPG